MSNLNFIKKSCENESKCNDVIANIKIMKLAPDLDEIPQEIDNNKLPKTLFNIS